MNRDRIFVTGANGTLGRALLLHLGPDVAIASTRTGQSPLPQFDHVPLAPDSVIPADVLARCLAVVNAAGSVTGEADALDEANVRLPLAIARAARAAGVPKFVQVSSFSVVGSAEHIDDTTVEAPINAYGRSKAEGDRQLQSFADDLIRIESVRLPLMFSVAKPGLLSPLLALATKLRLLPAVRNRPVRRSMMTYASAARHLADCAVSDRSGVSYAADPQPFDYELLISILADQASIKAGILPVPPFAAAAIDRIAPDIGRRLFRSSLLAPQANLAGDRPLDIEAELRALVNTYCGK
jgi:nucleoside-diphosphate-sugar epimerase